MEGGTDGIRGGDVVLDIGEGFGALVIYTKPELHGVEIEVSLKGVESPRTHAVIQERHLGDRVLFAGVFAELSAGDYRIWTDDPRLPAVVSIVSGKVAEIDWR